MKILLLNFSISDYVHTKFRLINRKWPPLDLLQAATLIKREGFAVELLDLRVMPMRLPEIKDRIREYDWVFITSTPLDKWQCPDPDFDKFIEFLSEISANEDYSLKIGVLGVHAKFLKDKIRNQTRISTFIDGQTEFGILNFLRGSSTFKPSLQSYNLDELSPPAYELVNLDNYYYELLGNRLALLETQRGCPHNCTFCFKEMYGSRVLRKSLSVVKDEIDYVVSFGAKSLYFIDLEFTLSKERTYEICEHILSRGYPIKWCCQTRVDAVDAKLLKIMFRSGCALIHYGVESGSETILKQIKKKITLTQVKEAINETKKAGIEVAGFFILGFPGETYEEIEQTISFAKSLPLDYASFHPYIPYNKIFKNSYNGHTPKTEHELCKLLRKAYMKFYLRPKYVISRLKRPESLARKIRLFMKIIR